jgi:hypothetical protein
MVSLRNNPWRPALMTRAQNHHPQAAGLSLCSFRFCPRGFTKMEARKAARSMTRITDDWTQLAAVFPFTFYSPCRAVRYGGAAPVGSRWAAGCCCLVVLPCAALPSAHFRLAGLVPLRAERTSGGGAHHERTVAATQSYPADVGWKDTPVIYCSDGTGKSASVGFAGQVGHGMQPACRRVVCKPRPGFLLAAHLDGWMELHGSGRRGQSRPGAVELPLSSVTCCPAGTRLDVVACSVSCGLRPGRAAWRLCACIARLPAPFPLRLPCPCPTSV